MLYLAGKYMMPLPWMNSTDVFFKLGAAYRRATVSTTAYVSSTTTAIGASNGGISNGKSTFVRPMFATGLEFPVFKYGIKIFRAFNRCTYKGFVPFLPRRIRLGQTCLLADREVVKKAGQPIYLSLKVSNVPYVSQHSQHLHGP